MDNEKFEVGENVEYVYIKRTYGGYDISLREGQIVSLHPAFAVIKPPKKGARRVSIYYKDIRKKEPTP